MNHPFSWPRMSPPCSRHSYEKIQLFKDSNFQLKSCVLLLPASPLTTTGAACLHLVRATAPDRPPSVSSPMIHQLMFTSRWGSWLEKSGETEREGEGQPTIHGSVRPFIFQHLKPCFSMVCDTHAQIHECGSKTLLLQGLNWKGCQCGLGIETFALIAALLVRKKHDTTDQIMHVNSQPPWSKDERKYCPLFHLLWARIDDNWLRRLVCFAFASLPRNGGLIWTINFPASRLARCDSMLIIQGGFHSRLRLGN